jgi:predicted transcriptional regulator
MARTKNFIDAIQAELAADPEIAGLVEGEIINAKIAREVHDLRKASGLTQMELAKKIGTTQSVISRIEDADYDGHSVALLRRIATALGKKVRVEFYSDDILTK